MGRLFGPLGFGGIHGEPLRFNLQLGWLYWRNDAGRPTALALALGALGEHTL